MSSKTLQQDNLQTEEVLENMKSASQYQFSGMPTTALGADKYTIATIVCDTSGSVVKFLPELTKTLKTILESCQKSPQSENLLIRLVQFDDDVTELHGFRELSQVDPNEYDTILKIGGYTALYDAVFQSVEITRDYAKVLANQDFCANAILFVITDGGDNIGRRSPNQIKDLILEVQREECLESIQIVLIGIVNGSVEIKNILQNFQNDAEITKYLNIDNANAKELAKLADWISKSISSTSQALGSGSASQLLQFP